MSNKNIPKSKLKNQLDILKTELGEMRDQINKLQKEYIDKTSKLKFIEAKIRAAEKDKITISDHAFVRYFERVKGFNLQEIENEMIPETLFEMAKVVGGNLKLSNQDYTVVVKDYTVTTIIK